MILPSWCERAALARVWQEPPFRATRPLHAGPRATQRGANSALAYLIGNITHDAELKQAKETGNRYGDFRLAVKNREGETVYFPVRCFGKLADGLIGVNKGVKVFVDGELEIAAFTGDDGDKHVTFRVIANTYRILGNVRREEATVE